jgi:hypothetical protein
MYFCFFLQTKIAIVTGLKPKECILLSKKQISRWRRRTKISFPLLGVGLLFALAWPCSIWAASVTLPKIQAVAGELVEIPVYLEKVENLAGMKLVLSYDSTILKFQEERKAPIAQSLMHIVNPKTPGKLIVVMAGAKGIQIKNGPIISLIFKVSDKFGSQKKISIKIEEVQLMTDQLKTLNPTIKNGAVVLLEKTAPKSTQ